MVMTIHKITAGDGYTYLTRQVARGDAGPGPAADAAAYYTAQGNPPGQVDRPRRAAAGPGRRAGDRGADAGPVRPGPAPRRRRDDHRYLAAHVRPGMTDTAAASMPAAAIRAATPGPAVPRLRAPGPLRRPGRAAPGGSSSRRPAATRTQAEVKKVRGEEARRQRAAVAGFDLVFAPVKSAALLWALDERPHVRDGGPPGPRGTPCDAALDLLEQHAAYTRTGTGGIAQIETNGLIAAAFDHYDSRAGDPNLHTHVAISSKVQGTDGTWRALDARALYRMAVAASECYNTAFETAPDRRARRARSPPGPTPPAAGAGARDRRRPARA